MPVPNSISLSVIVELVVLSVVVVPLTVRLPVIVALPPTDIAPLNQIKVLAYKEKHEWILETKYNIGKKKKTEE